MFSKMKMTLLGLFLALLLVQCATNPATGKRQLSLISEAQEIAMGREADQQVVAQYGLYPDEEMQRYVNEIGQRLAATSERPHLPWTFRVVDDPVVNAFALPGGFIYITRGILAHMSSEAELVGVLGHEIGHVTGRHGVNQMSKAQLAQLGLGVGSVLAGQDLSGTLGQGLGLMFLKFGRDAERQADDLGFRYLGRTGYPPMAMAEVFETLGRVSASGGSGRLPNWLSTHPASENRRARIEALTAAAPAELLRADWHRERYMQQLDDITFGVNPREGFFRDSTFYHPEMAFQIDFPKGWKGVNQRQQVGAMNPEKDAMVVLRMADGSTPQVAADKFFGQEGMTLGNNWVRGLGRGSVSRNFSVVTGQNQQGQQSSIEGGAAFVEHNGQVLQIMGMTREGRWQNPNGQPISDTAASFRRLRDRRILEVQPMHLKLVTLDRDMTLQEFSERYPSSVSIKTLGLINHAEAGILLRRGSKVKTVTGFNPADL
jgi:predicted Zn-dependent protease